MPVWLSFYGQCNVDLYFDKRRGKRGKYDIMCTLIYSNKSGEKLKKYEYTNIYASYKCVLLHKIYICIYIY